MELELRVWYYPFMPDIGEVVLISIQNKASAYARIEGIESDIKPRWYQVRLLFLGFPPQATTWILKREYLDGAPFTMKEIPIQITPLKRPGGYHEATEQKREPEQDHTDSPGTTRGGVISMDSVRAKKKKNPPKK
ncbi:MAG TPA: hypothetical protein ENN34_12695 [Deltaproteobacteria bacterium]|nr:hypothetical protein [Deltaproteobacteria bacterium]